ncbi:unnamed protein product [Miscanthus lutarioriparius]|uniref:Uncharacterized protein n=1 Tax=Miscanthus lutarioriparius TaxID=422564 RepID=A0A811R4E2_9POAL|nr:unnamed protein product [Miscanthus lutarioriparius]
MVEAEKTATLAPASCDALPSPAVQRSTSAPSTVVTVVDDVAQVATPSAQLAAAASRITYSSRGLLAELHRIPEAAINWRNR